MNVKTLLYSLMWVWVVLSFWVYDVVSTTIALDLGLSEQNPFITNTVYLVSDGGSLMVWVMVILTFKTVGGLLIIWTYYNVERFGFDRVKMGWSMGGVLSLFGLLVVVVNTFSLFTFVG